MSRQQLRLVGLESPRPDHEPIESPEPSQTGNSDVVDIRFDVVARVRALIAAGEYETPEKWEIAFRELITRESLI